MVLSHPVFPPLTGCDRLVSEPRISTPVYVDPKSSTQADGAQSSRVPVPLPEDPYEAIRQDGTDTESEPFEDPTDTETPDSPLAIAPPIPLSEKVAAMSESALRKRFRSSCKSSPSVSPPDLPLRKRYRRTSELVEDSEDDDDEEDEEIDENVVYRREVYSVESDGLGLEEEKEDVPWGQ
ncbi:hypothetical protein Tco_1506256 [Tanacetum coccineum]